MEDYVCRDCGEDLEILAEETGQELFDLFSGYFLKDPEKRFILCHGCDAMTQYQ